MFNLTMALASTKIRLEAEIGLIIRNKKKESFRLKDCFVLNAKSTAT